MPVITGTAAAPAGAARDQAAAPSVPAGQRDFKSAQQAEVERQTRTFDMAMDIVRLDPKLSDVAAMADKRDVLFALVDDVNQVAARVGEPGFRGDAFTGHKVVRHRDGTQDERHVVCINKDLTADLGKLVAVLQHELYHVKHVHEGKMGSRAQMEVEAFEASITGAGALAEKIRELAKTKPDAERVRWGRFADSIQAAGQADGKLLQEWRTIREQERAKGGISAVEHCIDHLVSFQPRLSAPPV